MDAKEFDSIKIFGVDDDNIPANIYNIISQNVLYENEAASHHQKHADHIGMTAEKKKYQKRNSQQPKLWNRNSRVQKLMGGRRQREKCFSYFFFHLLLIRQ